MTRKGIIGLVIGAVVLIGVTVWSLLQGRAPQDQVVVTEVEARTVTLHATVASSGTIQPARRADLAFSSGGTVSDVFVRVGDVVTAGAPLAAIGTGELQADLDSAAAQLNAARADYNTARNSGDNSRITSARSTLQARQNAYDNAVKALDAATIRAPFDGTVALVFVEPGDKVGGGSSALGGFDLSSLGDLGGVDIGSMLGSLGGSGSSAGAVGTSSGTAVTVISTNRFVVEATVGPADIGKLVKGQVVSIKPDGSGETLTGVIVQVGVMAESSGGAAAFPLIVEIDGDQVLYAGTGAQLEIVYETHVDVVGVPSGAITVNAAHETVVQVKTDTGSREQVVVTGLAEAG
ncbi:MAG: HlyD family efflux transporter periplasmic adaptor subunit, partial [Propionibacteriaceae bacterium]|nr:HlyD family efflux transporter periplasmic adaptor subunit [Propionibacteriaceae bacterium]